MAIGTVAGALTGGGGGAGTTDVMGFGRMVDEASEVLDSLDRPSFSHTIMHQGRKKGSYTRTEINISKLDVIIGTFILVALYLGIKTHRSAGSGIDSVLSIMNPFKDRLLQSGQFKTDSAGTSSGTVTKAFGGLLGGGAFGGAGAVGSEAGASAGGGILKGLFDIFF